MSSNLAVLSAPLGVDLMVTSKCNLHCLHCSASPEQFERDDMTTGDILAVIDELARCGIFRVALTGGEPLLHPDFFAIADAVLSHPIRLQINTNATLVTRAVASRLRNLKRPPFMSVSLDGVTADTHDRIRGRGSFEKVIAGIRTLVAAGLRVRPFMVVSRINAHEVPDVIDFVKQLGLKSIMISTPLHCARAVCYDREMRLDRDATLQLFETVRRADQGDPGLIDGPIVKLLRAYDAAWSGANDSRAAGGFFTNCSAGATVAAIGADGRVSPCQMLFSLEVGNIRDSSFADVWRNSSRLNEIRKTMGEPLREVPGCEGCKWQKVCCGPCPVEGFLRTGIWPAAGGMCLRDIGSVLGEKPLLPLEQEMLQ